MDECPKNQLPRMIDSFIFYGVPTHLTILATRAATSVCENGCRVLIGVFDVGIGRVVKIYEAK